MHSQRSTVQNGHRQSNCQTATRSHCDWTFLRHYADPFSQNGQRTPTACTRQRLDSNTAQTLRAPDPSQDLTLRYTKEMKTSAKHIQPTCNAMPCKHLPKGSNNTRAWLRLYSALQSSTETAPWLLSVTQSLPTRHTSVAVSALRYPNTPQRGHTLLFPRCSRVLTAILTH